jgi:hypothetical protein
MSLLKMVKAFALILLWQFWPGGSFVRAAGAAIEQDVQGKRVVLSDASRNLVLRLNYNGRCLLDQVSVGGREVIDGNTGVCSGIKIGGQWFTTRAGIPTPEVETTSNTLTVSGIRFGGGGMEVSEVWRFTVHPDGIDWRIDRTYHTAGTLEDTYFPGWDFRDISTWTGALLGDGGVAWCKLFDQPNASYGVHSGTAAFWNKDERAGLRVVPHSPTGGKIAVRFSRQPGGVFSAGYSVSARELPTRHNLARFRRDSQEIWQPFAVAPGGMSVELTLSAFDYNQAYNRGRFPGLDGAAMREISHTIARLGVVDELIIGSNGHNGAVLHEPWLAQLGLLVDDPDYFRNYGEMVDYQREHAVEPDGRVKPRWADGPGDEIPGTYDPLGFYECQWGWLMDSQTGWVINAADQFDFSGDRAWLQRQKSPCERALDYLLRRDTDGNGLVKMMNDSESEKKSSDWIDVVWASYENALVNAQMYWALSRWAGLEELLGDPVQAARYAQAAAKLKVRFNKSTSEGGFWDTQNRCYAYWLDKDGSAHGTNLVTPVNFSAIGYGLCDDPARCTAILDNIEARMEREKLFAWPLCFSPFAPAEAIHWEFPFPNYENGDIFLGWGELGTRAYAAHHPGLALKYVKNVLAQYDKDGLAFQRYLRARQTGAGDDILANNCSIVVGLYRNLYGLQPKYNRLYLEPHLAPELNGTQLNYQLRGQQYQIALTVDDYAIAVDSFIVRDRKPFAINAEGRTLEYFNGASQDCALAISPSTGERLELAIQAWPEPAAAERIWSESCGEPAATAQNRVSGLMPGASYRLSRNGKPGDLLRSDALGRVTFTCAFAHAATQHFALKLD